LDGVNELAYENKKIREKEWSKNKNGQRNYHKHLAVIGTPKTGTVANLDWADRADGGLTSQFLRAEARQRQSIGRTKAGQRQDKARQRQGKEDQDKGRTKAREGVSVDVFKDKGNRDQKGVFKVLTK
jgi:hypothetical protein